MTLFRRRNTPRHRVLIGDAKLARGQNITTLIKYDRYGCLQQRLFKCGGVRKHSRSDGEAPPLSALGQNRDKAGGRIVPIKHAERVRDREAFEWQWNADFPRARRMARLLIVGSLWEGRCYFGIPNLQSEGTRDTNLLKIRTVFECGNHRDECGIEHVAVIIDARRIDV